MPPKLKVQPRRQPPRGAANLQGEETTKDLPLKETVAEDAEMTEDASEASERLPPEPIIPISASGSTPPATQATKRPVQRLDSLHRRTIRHGASESRPAGGLKFQPKSFIRRSKEEREAQEQAEAERRQTKLAAAGPSSLSTVQRGGFNGRGVGRGNFSGGMNRFNANRYAGGQASGHLGGGTVGESGKKKKPGLGSLSSGPRSSTTGGASKSRVKSEPSFKSERDRDGDVVMGATRTRPMIKKEGSGPTYISSDDELDTTEGPRVNIEHINLVSEDDSQEDDEPIRPTQRERRRFGRDLKGLASGLKPIRIDRHEHVERAVGVNTESSSTTMADVRRKAKERALAEGGLFLSEDEPEVIKIPKAKGKGKAKDVEFVKDERRWQGVYPDEEDIQSIPRIKEEPQDDTDRMIIDDVEPPRELPTSAILETANPPTSPKASRKAEKPLLRRKHKRRRANKPRTAKPVLQTTEDRQEWERYQEDLFLLSEELGFLTTTPHLSAPEEPVAGEEEGPGKADSELKDSKEKDRRQGLVYLFQLPPIIPILINPAKTEEADSASPEVTEHLSPPPAKLNEKHSASMTPPTTNPFSGSHKTEAKIKPDPDSKGVPTTIASPSVSLGKAGRLTVHSSGRVTTTWGDVAMEMGKGGDGGILQECVLWQSGKQGLEAIGQIAGGFVGVPEWG